jgi:VanZ family protein
MNMLIQRWGPAALVMAVIFIASSTPGSDLPDYGSWDFIIKKCGHMLGYTLLTIAYCYGLTRYKTSAKIQLIMAISLAVLYSISDELHQLFVSGRNASPLDVLIDTTGAALGLFIWNSIRNLKIIDCTE